MPYRFMQVIFCCLRNIKNKTKVDKMKTKILMIGTLLVTQTACSGISSLSVHDGGEFFEMRGTPQGIRAYNDGQSGLITTGKSTPDAQTDYFATRREQAAQRLRRYVSTTKKQGVK